jgi:hypothetical protein
MDHVRIIGSEEGLVSIIRMTRTGKLGTTLTVTTAKVIHNSPILVTLMKEVIRSSETPILKFTRRLIPKEGILYCHRRGNLQSYIIRISSILPNPVQKFLLELRTP